MKLARRQRVDAENRLEAWVTQSHQKRVLAGDTTPVGPCPDESFLRDIARKSKKIALSDSRIDHTATCPTCMTQLLEIRREARLGRRMSVIARVCAAFLVAIAIIAIVRYELTRKSPSGNAAIVSIENGGFVGHQYATCGATQSIAPDYIAGDAREDNDYLASF